MRIVLAFILVVIFTSCDNTLNLNADFEDIPIVYGLLSVSDENQFIRVERAFLDPERPASEIAVIPDSIYYANLDVSLLNVGSNESFSLSKVDGNEIGLPREEGAFAVNPNTLYTISTEDLELAVGESYQLRIDRGEGSEIVTAETTVVDTLIITQPGTRLNFDFGTNFRVRWFPISTGNEPSVFDVSMVIYFNEVDILNPDVDPVSQELTWSLGKSIVGDTEIERLGDEFFNFLNNNLDVDVNLRRDFQGIDIIVDAGGEEILDYVRVGQANLGITASQDIPFFSNLSEGRGIFSSRNRKIKSRVLLSPVTQELMGNDELTRDLNFNF